MAEFLLGRDEPLVLDYHNVTPASFYEGWEEHTAGKVALAREQVAELAPRAVLGIADSAFNARELEALGCPATAVVPILVDLDAAAAPSTPAERAPAGRRATATPPCCCSSGGSRPNKSHERLVEALWAYRRLYDPDGPAPPGGPGRHPGLRRGGVRLRRRARAWPTPCATREGLTAAELAAWYEDADVFVCLSAHEGFCIPLLEAMRAGTPIVALDAGAVGETLADAGILLDRRPARDGGRGRATGSAATRAWPGALVAAGRRRLGRLRRAAPPRRRLRRGRWPGWPGTERVVA